MPLTDNEVSSGGMFGLVKDVRDLQKVVANLLERIDELESRIEEVSGGSGAVKC